MNDRMNDLLKPLTGDKGGKQKAPPKSGDQTPERELSNAPGDQEEPHAEEQPRENPYFDAVLKKLRQCNTEIGRIGEANDQLKSLSASFKKSVNSEKEKSSPLLTQRTRTKSTDWWTRTTSR